MFGTWMRRVAFGVASLKKPYTPRKDGALEGKSEATTNMGIFCKCGRGEGRSGCYVRQSEMLKELTVAKPAIQLLLFRQ